MKPDREFDAFGPWILAVEEERDVPRLFRGSFEFDDTVRLVLKIPRHITRRNARPGMDLYDHLVVISETEILILDRMDSGKEPRRRVAPLNDLLAVGKLTDLLLGELQLHLREETVTVPFNTISEELIDEAIGIIRESAYHEGGPGVSAGKAATDELTPLYRNLLKQERRLNGAELLAYQPSALVDKKEKTLWDRIADIYALPLLRETMILSNTRELILYNREPMIIRRRTGHYGYLRTLLPLFNLSAFEREANPRYRGVEDLSFVLGPRRIRCVVGESFPDLRHG